MRLLALSIFFVAAARSSAAGVLVVAADGSGSYLDLQPAVDAAQDGDVILVRSGTYGTFAIADRSITITADVGASVVIQGAARVRNLSPGRTAILSGLRATGSGTTVPGRHGLYLSSNAGRVRIQSCTFAGAGGVPTNYAQGYSGGNITDCADVAFDACVLEGGAAAGGFEPTFPPSGAGLEVTQSTVTIHDGALFGGSALDLEPYGHTAGIDGGYGGAGLRANASIVALSGVDVRAGDGGNGALFGPLYTLGGNGGNGIEASSATVYLHDSAPIPGQGGWGYLGSMHQSSLDGLAGQARVGAQFVDWIGSNRTLVVGGPLREGATVDVTIQGSPGDVVHLGIASGAGYSFWPAPAGPYLLALPAPPRAAKFAIVGTIPGSGVLTWTSTVPELGPGVASKNVHFQAVCVDAVGTRFLTGARVLVELDQAW